MSKRSFRWRFMQKNIFYFHTNLFFWFSNMILSDSLILPISQFQTQQVMTHRCCYECYQHSQFTEDNAEPSFLPGINSLWWYLILAYYFGPSCRNENRGAKEVGHGSGEGVPYPQDGWDLGRWLRPSQDSLWHFLSTTTMPCLGGGTFSP